MSKKKKIIISVCVAAVLILLLVIPLVQCSNAIKSIAMNQNPQSTVLKEMTLSNTVSVTGTVQSADSVKVYPKYSGMVKTIEVEVGDVVKEGDLLCELDSQTLQTDIAQSKASMDAQNSSAKQQISANQKRYENAIKNLNDGLNPQVYAATSALSSAKSALDQATSAYNTAAAGEKKTALDAAKAALDTATAKNNEAQAALTAVQTQLDDLTAKLNSGQITQADYDAQKAVLDTSLTAAQSLSAQTTQELTTATEAYNNANVAYNTVLAPLQAALNGAQDTYNKACTEYDITLNSAKQEIDALKDGVSASKTAANDKAGEIMLDAKEQQLADYLIRAPKSGTITAVYAVEGSASSGALFLIEDMDSLEVSGFVKEYDIDKVSPGMAVKIESDGTGEAVYDGKLKRLAPAAAEKSSSLTSAANAGSSSPDVEFGCIMDVTSKDTKLRIGMTAKANIILEQKENVLAVPYDAITQNEAGKDIIYVVGKGTDGLSTFTPMPITTGLETDFYTEISGDGIKSGLVVVSDASALFSTPSASAGFSMMPPTSDGK
ncbi:MAG: efflux RND transporter periplasmic adaptor subunit [Christensenellaceae bacterium]